MFSNIALNRLLFQYIFFLSTSEKKIKTLLMLILIMKKIAKNTIYIMQELCAQKLLIFS